MHGKTTIKTGVNINPQQTNGQCCAIKCTSFLNEREYTVPQWALKLISAPAATEIWNLKGCILNITVDLK
jgi:predicted secreted Zn-dependent protease